MFTLHRRQGWYCMEASARWMNIVRMVGSEESTTR